ncbi:hypothetical protein GCK32_012760 [Trichostrongylus colubriformis]|uniref:Uncharacterized protein n=1 Tax=Trichostrongylus colubriformis TaxID=6319 RepID=A0AAN8IKG0_TRICO
MLVLKLTAFMCIFVQAIAYSRNEGEIKLAPSSPKEDEEPGEMDFLSELVLGYSISEMQSMMGQKDAGGFFENNVAMNEFKKRILDNTDKPKEERDYAATVSSILVAVVSRHISTSQAVAQVEEAWNKMSKSAQDEWAKDIAELFTDHMEGKIKNK